MLELIVNVQFAKNWTTVQNKNLPFPKSRLSWSIENSNRSEKHAETCHTHPSEFSGTKQSDDRLVRDCKAASRVLRRVPVV